MTDVFVLPISEEEIMGEVLIFVQELVKYLYGHVQFWNILFAIAIIFFERKEPKSVWAWLLLLTFLPGLGFVFYLLLGTNLRKKKMFRMKEIEDDLHKLVKYQEQKLRHNSEELLSEELKEYADLVMYNLETSGAVLTQENEVTILTDGNEKFDSLLEDIKKAKHFIHMEYYIIKNDVLFNRLVTALQEKVKEGVEVRILFDGMGCRSVSHRYWRKLRESGIQTAEFFPALFRRFHLRVNYRNHRKIVVIDNKVGYVGGFNIGREYIGLDEKFGYWRDTHLRIRGDAVYGLQLRFLLDWNYAAQENLFAGEDFPEYLDPGIIDGSRIQIISSGPDLSRQQIRDNYLQMIHKAKKSILIQTPYFIPDEAVLTALIIAVKSGVDVRIMIPCKPDHPFVYWATYSYVGELLSEGAKVYTYENGFLHSKGMVTDEQVFCYGTANMDIRSFALNFEVNAIVYDPKAAGRMADLFRQDLEKCREITPELYGARGIWIRFKEQICRLLSPLL